MITTKTSTTSSTTQFIINHLQVFPNDAVCVVEGVCKLRKDTGRKIKDLAGSGVWAVIVSVVIIVSRWNEDNVVEDSVYVRHSLRKNT